MLSQSNFNDQVEELNFLVVGSLSAAGETLTGDLSDTDDDNPDRRGSFSDDYTLVDVIPGDSVTISLNSPDFDTYLQLIDADTGDVIDFNDDFNDLNSQLTFIAESDINYLVRVTSFGAGEIGDYTLSTEIPEPPDLRVTDATVAGVVFGDGTANVTEGQSFEVSWTVENQGQGDLAGFYFDAIYLSDDPFLDFETDQFITDVDRVDLPNSGDSVTESLNIVIGGLEGGGGGEEFEVIGEGDEGEELYLLFVTDAFEDIPESDEDNNILAFPIELGTPDVNLSVTSGTVTPTTIPIGGTVEVSWEVTNSGTEEALGSFGSWTDYLYLSEDNIFDGSDTFVASEFIGFPNVPLAGEDSYTITRNVNLPSNAGGNFLLVVTDRFNDQSETDETDNVLPIAIDITAPNLVIADAQTTDLSDNPITEASLGQTIRLNWTVENDGGAITTSSSWRDYFYLSDDEFFDNSDTFISSSFISSPSIPLDQNQTYNLTQNITIPNSTTTGNRFILVWTDRFNSQAENSESDNVSAIPIEIIAPNLIVQTAEINDTNNNPISEAAAGQTIQLDWTVQNNGAVATTNSFWRDYFYLSEDEFFDNSDTFITSRFIGSPSTPLDPSETYNLNQNITLPSSAREGSGFILVWTDRDNNQGESNNDDNILAVPLEVVVPNLEVSAAQLTDTAGVPLTTVTLGQLVNLSWTTLNSSSNVEALGNWSDQVYISDDQIFDGSDTLLLSQFTGGFTPLAARDDYTINRTNLTIPLTATGDRFLLFVADSTGVQAETDETDNVLVIPIQVNAPPIVGTISAANGMEMGDLSNTDSNNPTRSGRFSDDYELIDLNSGELVTIELSSGDYNPYVQIINADTQQVIVQDDNSGQGTNARLSFIVQDGINYIVRVTSSFSSETGNYDLSANGVAAIPLSTNLSDSDGFLWDIQQDGSISNGTIDAYDGGMRLSGFPNFSGAQTEETGREIVIGSSANVEGLEITRKVYVPENQSWARFLEIVTNVSDAPINHTVDIETNLGSGSSTIVVATSNGDTNFTPEDVWIVTDDSSDGFGDPTLLHLVAGLGGQIPSRTSLDFDQLSYEYDLTVAPGETQIVMHLAAQNDNRADAQTKAEELALLNLDLFAGMSETEQQQLVNFATEGLVINDVTVLEGNSDNTTAEFTVTLLNEITEVVTVDYETIAGTAEADVDYVSTSDTLTFLPGGDRRQTIAVEIIGDTVGERDETFTVRLSNATGAVIADGEGIGTIDNDDLIPVDLELSLLVDVSGSVDNNEYNLQIEGYANIFDDPSIYNDLISRGIEGSVAINLVVWSSSNQQQESIAWTLIDSVESSQAFAQDIRETLLPEFGGSRPFSGGTDPGPAIDFATPLFFNNDFDSRRQTIDVSGDGTGSASATEAARDNALAAGIDVINGIVIGGSSSVLSFYENSLIGGVNAEGTPAIAFEANTFSEFEQVVREKLTFEFTPPPKISIEDLAQFEGNSEGTTQFVVTVSLDRANDEQPVTVTYSTEDDTAVAGEDYTSITDTITFAPGETVQTLIIEVNGDITPELDETFLINLSNPVNADIIRGQGLITIIADEDPDLTITDVTASKLVVSPGELLDVDWTVTNAGIEDADASWLDSVYYSEDDTLSPEDQRLADRGAGPLGAETSYDRTQEVTIPFNVTAGDHFLLVETDLQNQQEEFNEDNNIATIPIEVVLPDLVVNSVLAPATANFGDTITINWEVANLGTGSALGAWSDRIYLSTDTTISGDDRLLVTESAPSTLAPSEIYNQSASFTLPLDNSIAEGTYFILVQTDDLSQQVESDENNNLNLDQIELTIPPLPDLIVSDIIAPIEAFSGQDIIVSWTLTNQGEATASGTWTDQVFLSEDTTVGGDQFLDSFSFTGILEAGESITRQQVVTLPVDLEGDRYVVVSTDTGNQIFELNNENNNTTIDDQVMAVELSPFPNLQVASVTAPPTAFSSQETVVEWIVTNTGTGATSTPTWTDRVWLSLDQTLDETDTFLGQVNNPSFLNVGDSYSNSLTVTLPQGIDNDYFFIVKTDATNRVLELDKEDDNENFGGPTDVMLTPPPDLQVTNVNAPFQAFSGQPMTLSWTVTNEGEGRTLESNWFDRIYMSADDVIDDSDFLLAQQSRSGALETEESYTVSRDVTLPIGVSGDFFFIIQTDAGSQVFEQAFEGNNTGFDATATTVNLTPPPDLEVELVDAPAEATASRSFSINYRVTNFGATPTPNSFWRDAFYLSEDDQFDPESDFFLGQRNHSGALDIGDSYQETATFTLPNALTGDFFVFVVTDSPDDVFELDNDNNVGSDAETVTIVSRPADLVVSAASAPITAEAGNSLRVDWTVSNQGTGDTVVSSWTDRIVASVDGILGNGDDVTLKSFNHSGLLDVGDSYNRSEVVEIPFTFVGDYNFFVVTDVGNNVFEDLNETNNNSNALPINVMRETPDLQVTVVNSPETALTATIIPFSWTVENLGAGKTNSNFWYDEVFLSTDQDLGDDNDIFLGRIRRNNVLASGENYTATANLLIPLEAVGDYYVIVRTDEDNQVFEEPLENNNDGVSVGQIMIEANPNPDPDLVDLASDLVIETVIAPEEGFSGQSLEVSWTVRNDGDSTGNRSWFDSVYLSRDQVFDRNSDIFLGSRSRANLSSGDSYTTTANFDLPRGLSGPFYVFVATDSTNRINEPDGEFNNSDYDPNATEIILLPPADLVAGTITIPVNGSPGQDATLTYTVENQSSENALGRWTDSIYISEDDQWDVNDPLFAQVSVSGPVNAGDSYTNTVTASLPGVVSGDYHVIVRSDIRNNIAELDEENNLRASVDQFNLDVEVLVLDIPDTDNLAEEQSIFYQVDVPAGETLVITLDSDSVDGFNELYVSHEEVPSRADFDFAAIEPFNVDQRIVIPTTEAGTYFIQAFGNDVPEGTASYDIIAEIVEFSVFDDDYGRGGNVGNLTIEIDGAKFDRTVTASLTDGISFDLPAISMFYEDQTLAYATFDLRGLNAGVYDVVVQNAQGESITVEDGLEVVNGGGSEIIPQVDAPASVARNRSYTFNVSWGNSGLNDGVSPVILVENTVPFGFSPGDTSAGSSYTFLAENTDGGPPGILRPGQSENRTFFSFSDNQPGDYTVTVNRFYKDLDAPFDWESLRESLTPAGMSDAEFAPIFDQLIAQVGTTTGDYLEMISENSALIPEELGSSEDIGALLEIEVNQAQAAVTTSISGFLEAEGLNVDISGRTVIGTNTDTGEEFTSISLNDGSFALVDLSPGIYEYQVGFAPFESEEPTTTVADGDMISGLSLEIGNGATIMGEVEDSASMSIPEALIAVYEGTELVVANQADENGNFKFMGLEAGTYTIETYLPDSLDSFTNEVTVAANEILTITLSDTETAPLMLPENLTNDEVDLNHSSPLIANFEVPNPIIEEIKQRIRQALGNVIESILEEVVELAIEAIGEVTEEIIDTVVETATDLYLDALELVVSPAVQAGAYAVGLRGDGFAGGSAAKSLYNQYFNSTGPVGTVSFGDGSTVSNSFKNNPVTQGNIDTIQSEALQAIKDMFANQELPCDHPRISQTFSISSLNIPSSDLLNAIGGTGDAGDWDFPFTEDLAGVIAGGNGEGGGVGSNRPVFPDTRKVEGEVFLIIPAGSSQAQVIFDLTVTIEDTVDFVPGNVGGIPVVREILEGAAVLERNGRAFDVPFTSTFAVDLASFNFSVDLEDDCDDDDDDDEDDTRRPTSSDPNDILGPEGFGEENWITASSPLEYKIRFENDPIFATAPAQVVRITQQLDDDLDFRTFRVGDFGFGDVFVDVPDNRAFYQTTIDLTEDLNIFVDVIAGIDITTGEAFWEFTSIDPETGELPLDALTGFLPPNLTSPEGDGFVNYSILPKSTATTGDVIDAEATIVFDINEPISTPPIFNTLDTENPTSSVAELPLLIEDENGEFLVTWTGSDDQGGSAIANFDIYVSENGEPFTIWLENTTLTEAVFVGEPGKTYGFYSIAQDNAGNLEPTPTEAQAVTQIAGGSVNEPPILNQNTGLEVDEEATATITMSELEVTDTDNLPDEITYTLTVDPVNGSLLLDGVGLAVGDTFTQEAINNGLISYNHDGSETITDSFSFTVSDGAGGSIEDTAFEITVNPVNDPPILFVNAGLTLEEGATVNIENTVLQVTDVDNSEDQLTYTLTTTTANGTLQKDGADLTGGDTFSQQDIDSGLISYIHDGSNTSSDNFSFTVSDGAGGNIEETVFNINIGSVNNPPNLTLNEGLTLDEGLSATIDNTLLQVTDSDNLADEITYSLTVDSANGNLLLDGVGLTVGDTFTQEAIDNNLLSYNHDGSETISDSFSFTVSDGAGGSIEETAFDITVNPVNDPPILFVNAGLSLEEGATVDIENTALQVTDVDNSEDQLIYTLATITTNGILQKDGADLSLGDTFSQQDIDSGLISYIHDGSNTSSDNFSFTVSDGAGGNIEDTVFEIIINSINQAPTDIEITNLQITENAPDNALIGTFSTVDPDVGDTHTYILLDDAGGRFQIIGNQLRVADSSLLDFEADSDHDIMVESSDGELTVQESLTVNLIDDRDFDVSGTPEDDLISSGTGGEIIAGAGGQDTFIYDDVNDFGDTITDFNAVNDDKIDLRPLYDSLESIPGFDLGSTPFDDFVAVTATGVGSQINVAPYGNFAPDYKLPLATLEAVNPGDVDATDFLFN